MHELYVVLLSNSFINLIFYPNLYFDSFLHALFRPMKFHTPTLVPSTELRGRVVSTPASYSGSPGSGLDLETDYTD
jgi:hypothetical protein